MLGKRPVVEIEELYTKKSKNHYIVRLFFYGKSLIFRTRILMMLRYLIQLGNTDLFIFLLKSVAPLGSCYLVGKVLCLYRVFDHDSLVRGYFSFGCC